MKLDRLRRIKLDPSIWTSSLILLAVATFTNRFGQGLLNGVRTNFFIDTLGMTGGQVLWLEGIRELPGLGLIFIAALMMRLPLSRRAAVSVLIMGIGFILYAFVGSYVALLVVAVISSLGMHMWMPLNSSLCMCLSNKGNTGRVLGTLNSVGALAGLAGMGLISVLGRFTESVPLNVYYVAGGIFIILAAALFYRLPTNIGSTEAKQPRMLLRKRYWLYYVLTFFQGSRKQVLNTFGTLMLVDKFGLRVWEISTLLLASSIIRMFAGPYVGRLVDRVGERKTLSISYALLTLCCLGFAAVTNVWVLIGLLLTIKLAVMLGMGLNTYVYRMAPAEELTPTLSAGISINHVTSVAMPIVAGAVLPLIGYQGVFVGTAGLILLSIPFAAALKVTTRAAAQPQPAGAE